jgi:hypothetical protein
MVGDLIGGQEDTQEALDLSRAHAHGEGSGRESLQLVLIEADVGSGRRLRRGDRLGMRSILNRGIRRRLGGEPLFELLRVLGDGLAAAAGLLSLAGDGAMATGG